MAAAFLPPCNSQFCVREVSSRRYDGHETGCVEVQQRRACSRNATRTRMSVAYPHRATGYDSGRMQHGGEGSGTGRRLSRTSDIVETAAAVPIIKTLVALLRETGLDYELAKSGPFTVFAPTDTAFSQLCEPRSFKLYASLLRPVDRCALRRLLSCHIVKGLISSGEAIGSGKVVGVSLAGVPLTITGHGNRMSAGSGSVVKADIPCANGVIHLISSVLTPSTFAPLPDRNERPHFYSDGLDVYSNSAPTHISRITHSY
jgi:uncharacterized surface protein with fasciclin (FAS1) repeats